MGAQTHMVRLARTHDREQTLSVQVVPGKGGDILRSRPRARRTCSGPLRGDSANALRRPLMRIRRLRSSRRHHPAFAAPLLGPRCVVTTSARSFTADDLHGLAARGRTRRQERRPVTAPRPQQTAEHLGYLSNFQDGARISLENPDVGLRVDLRWDQTIMSHAWYWLEAHATSAFPWFGRAYVLGLEPATSHPALGLEAVRRKTGAQLSFMPSESKVVEISLAVSSISTSSL